ncbi:unnamed protein product [Amoebophrya sp. A25]|nr:unnamed protein product [Amoebophrya sp. A25]|eukprot:GSA25T00013806001.1
MELNWFDKSPPGGKPTMPMAWPSQAGNPQQGMFFNAQGSVGGAAPQYMSTGANMTGGAPPAPPPHGMRTNYNAANYAAPATMSMMNSNSKSYPSMNKNNNGAKDPLADDFAALVGFAGVTSPAAGTSGSFAPADRAPPATGPAMPWGSVNSNGSAPNAVTASSSNAAASSSTNAKTKEKKPPPPGQSKAAEKREAEHGDGGTSSSKAAEGSTLNSMWSAFFGSGEREKKKERRPAKKERELSAMEAEASIQQAVGAKTKLVSNALQQKLKQAEAERRRLARIDAQMQHLDASEQRDIAAMREQVETMSGKIANLRRDSDSKRAALERATQDYVDATERLQDAEAEKKEIEENLVEMILQSGKKKDEQLNKLLCEIEAEDAAAAGATVAGSAAATSSSSESKAQPSMKAASSGKENMANNATSSEKSSDLKGPCVSNSGIKLDKSYAEQKNGNATITVSSTTGPADSGS